MVGICTSPYPIEKVEDFPYPYPYLVNAGISRQNGDEFKKYPRRQVYLPSLYTIKVHVSCMTHEEFVSHLFFSS